MKSGDRPLEPRLVIGWVRTFFQEIHQFTNHHAELQWPVITFRVPIFLQDWPPLMVDYYAVLLLFPCIQIQLSKFPPLPRIIPIIIHWRGLLLGPKIKLNRHPCRTAASGSRGTPGITGRPPPTARRAGARSWRRGRRRSGGRAAETLQSLVPAPLTPHINY